MNMTASMTSFNAGDVVWVSFPHVENERTQTRPALVISAAAVGPGGALFWALMITNALRPDWPGDLVIDDYELCGLPAPSKIRTEKITTLERKGAARIGKINANQLTEVQRRMSHYFGFRSAS
jgi:mRNA interferase MazF